MGESELTPFRLAEIRAHRDAARPGEWVYRTDVGDLLAEIDRQREQLSEALETLGFYADPDTYFAIGFFPDAPCGEFMDDWSEHGDISYEPGDERPGKRARSLLDRLSPQEPS